MDLAEQFYLRFEGLDRAHGRFHTSDRERDDGKKQGRAEVVHASPTPVLWAQHLNGEAGIGIFPLRDDGTCIWGCIDIDVYEGLDLKLLEKRIEQFKLPLVVCRSKSGGAHVFLFTSEPVDAKLLRAKLMEWAVALGYGGVEVFPKQTRLANDKDVGNWLNMPYFDGNTTVRYAMRGGKSIKTDAFLKLAEKKAVDNDELEAIHLESHELLEEAPPCLQSLARSGFPEGQRNNGLFNIGVYVRERYGDENISTHLDEMNQAFMDPPLGAKEVTTIGKTVGKKKYYYKCTDQPIVSACNKQICLTRKYGIGSSHDDPGVEIGGMIKLMTDPVTWIIEVNGMRLEMSTATLLSQRLFQHTVLEKCTILMKPVKPNAWQKMMDEKLKTCEEQDAPSDAGPVGVLIIHLEDFCTSYAKTYLRDELLQGKPWINEEDGRTYFRSPDFQRYLEQQRFRGYDGRKIFTALRTVAGVKHGQFTIKGKNVQWWSVPSFTEMSEDLDTPDMARPEEPSDF